MSTFPIVSNPNSTNQTIHLVKILQPNNTMSSYPSTNMPLLSTILVEETL